MIPTSNDPQLLLNLINIKFHQILNTIPHTLAHEQQACASLFGSLELILKHILDLSPN